MKLALEKNGYVRVGLKSQDKIERRSVHTLVLAAFVGPRPPGKDTRHWNNVRHDNRLENLLYGTKVENMADKKRHGTTFRMQGVEHPSAKLTDADVREIRRTTVKGEYGIVARMYGVCRMTICNIMLRRIWTHVN